MLEFEIHQFQTIKLALHIAQGVFIFVAWAIEIAVFKSDKSVIDGRTGWHFALCFLTMPAIIFLTMTPRFPRTRKLVNPYAMAALDGVFCILWLSAFAALASWNSAGRCGAGCGLSKAVVGVSVFIWLLWIATTLMSLYGVVYFMREGYYPGLSRAPTNAQMIDPDKDAFSTAPHDDEYVPVQHDDHEIPVHSIDGPLEPHNYNSSSSRYGEPSSVGGGLGGNSYHESSSYGGGAYAPPTVSEDTSYGGYSGGGHDTGYSGGNNGPTVSDNGRVHFPAARYDNLPALGERN